MICSPFTVLLGLPGLALPGLLAGCSFASLPSESPPLFDMEEPLPLQKEPDDEAARVRLPAGSFAGIYVKSAWFEEPDEPGQQPDALEVTSIVENSPAAAADLREGDLLVSVAVGGAAALKLAWPAQWRKIEAEATPGTVLHLELDRAGVERKADVRLVPRVKPAARQDSERFREEQRAGIVVRTATEVEARGAGLGSGGGAVLIGMAASSPWRRAGLRFGDLIVQVQDREVHHPQVLLGAIRTAPPGTRLRVSYLREGGKKATAEIPLTARDQDITSVYLPLLFSYESKRRATETSFLFGLLSYKSTAVAWEFGFLWFFSISGGDSDRLEEVLR